MLALPAFQIASLRNALQATRNENLRLKNADMKVGAYKRQVMNIVRSIHTPEMCFYYVRLMNKHGYKEG